ncbi:hypothetical protein PAL_GLEAN10001126 [Pteropus alecto]|uniref:Uncharacterized protein n=1 Tax=Pteropus alecto TaxID=9402 RepID=L5K818_PTEAL|nr:hypothetical protein PAL_GLEAN10001126 [Pteropus alecto]
MLGTQGLQQGSHFVVIVSQHRGEKVVLDLEVDVPTKAVIEGGLVDIACCLELGEDPVRVPVVINVHGDTVHLCHSHKPVAFQEPDHEEKAHEAFHPQLHSEDLPQGKEEGVHIDVWVFVEAVRLHMVLGA